MRLLGPLRGPSNRMRTGELESRRGERRPAVPSAHCASAPPVRGQPHQRKQCHGRRRRHRCPERDSVDRPRHLLTHEKTSRVSGETQLAPRGAGLAIAVRRELPHQHMPVGQPRPHLPVGVGVVLRPRPRAVGDEEVAAGLESSRVQPGRG